MHRMTIHFARCRPWGWFSPSASENLPGGSLKTVTAAFHLLTDASVTLEALRLTVFLLIGRNVRYSEHSRRIVRSRGRNRPRVPWPVPAWGGCSPSAPPYRVLLWVVLAAVRPTQARGSRC